MKSILLALVLFPLAHFYYQFGRAMLRRRSYRFLWERAIHRAFERVETR